MAQSGRMGRYPGAGFERQRRGGGGNAGDQQLHKIGVDAAKLATEQIKGISSQVRTFSPTGRCLLLSCVMATHKQLAVQIKIKSIVWLLKS